MCPAFPSIKYHTLIKQVEFCFAVQTSVILFLIKTLMMRTTTREQPQQPYLKESHDKLWWSLSVMQQQPPQNGG